MFDFRQVVTRAPVAAVDHDGHWMRTPPRRHAQITELLRGQAIAHPFISRRRSQTQNVVAGHGKILLTAHVVRCFPIHVWHHRWNTLIPGTGLILCFIWYSLVNSYKDLNAAKFAVIHELENQLLVALRDAHC
jgi:hypothetical protein